VLLETAASVLTLNFDRLNLFRLLLGTGEIDWNFNFNVSVTRFLEQGDDEALDLVPLSCLVMELLKALKSSSLNSKGVDSGQADLSNKNYL